MLLVINSSIPISNAKALYVGRLLSLLQFSEWKHSESEVYYELKMATHRGKGLCIQNTVSPRLCTQNKL